jgi:acetylornithine/succinyldiaminopimelate/putrescine aminotransferase
MSMMGAPEGEEWKAEFRPLLPDTRAIEFNSFEDLKYITERTAGVLCEVVQGEAGVRLPDEGWLKALRERCTEVGALLIFDEIQTGMGRTGEMFASIKYGVTPDVVTLAKAFGGGMPLGGVAARRDVLNLFTENPCLGHITTFGGHPVCCAAGLAALNYMVDNGVVEQVESKGALFEQRLLSHPRVQEIRRSGLLLAVELGRSEYLYQLMDIFKQEGIMSDWFLFCDTAFRISPPLTISEEEIEECCTIIRQSLDRIE